MTKKIVIIFIILAALVLSVCAFVWFKDGAQKPASTEQPISATTNADTVKPENTATTTSDLKTYRNDEWSFEFQYPSDLILKEKVFGGYYSKFNLEIFLQKKGLDSVFLLNIVLPEFVNTSFWKSQENTSKVFVDGVEGIRYEYEYEGSPQTAVVLPFGDYKIILGTGDGSKPYTEELNQIISSFKFLKK